MLAGWMKRRREQLELSQEELTSALQLEGYNVSRSTVSAWENRKFNIPIDDPEFRRAITRALSTTTTELLAAAGLRVDSDEISEAARRAASIVNNLSPANQKIAIELLLVLERETS